MTDDAPPRRDRRSGSNGPGLVGLGYTIDNKFALLLPDLRTLDGGPYILLIRGAKLFRLPVLLSLAPWEYWEQRYRAHEGGIRCYNAAEDLLAACVAAGPYEPNRS
jgi:hypothetical protein